MRILTDSWIKRVNVQYVNILVVIDIYPEEIFQGSISRKAETQMDKSWLNYEKFNSSRHKQMLKDVQHLYIVMEYFSTLFKLELEIIGISKKNFYRA